MVKVFVCKTSNGFQSYLGIQVLLHTEWPHTDTAFGCSRITKAMVMTERKVALGHGFVPFG